jgi:hypothetical protein
MAFASYQHKFKKRDFVNIGFKYTFTEKTKIFLRQLFCLSTGTSAFKLLSDEQVYDFNFDYIKPLKYGRIETGIKL